RLIAGGALLVAAFMKLKDPSNLMLSMEAFELLPVAVVPFLSFFLPWLELIVGLTLIYGYWSRPSAALASGLYIVFSLALASVIWRGMKVDCGCFGALTGGGPVTYLSILRNVVFMACS